MHQADIVRDLGSSLGSVYSVVGNYLNYRTVYAHWVPDYLADSHKDYHVGRS